MTTVPPPAPSGGGFLGSVDPGVTSYGLGVTLGILLLIITVALASYHCVRAPPPAASVTVQRPLAIEGSLGRTECAPGLDEATLLSYPKVLYSKTNKENKETTATCCAICLEDYNGNDTVRVLPDCGHLFHVRCVDLWIRQHPTCPVCRTSPLPTPLATPLAAVGPLASGTMV